MEILKHGNTYGEKKCDKCGCEFAFTGKDTATCTKPYEDKVYVFVLCPECHKAVIVSEIGGKIC